MKRVLSFLLVLFSLHTLPVLANSDAKAEINAAINRLAQAFVSGDPADISALMTADHLAITPYYGRPYSVEEQVGTLDGFKFELTEMGEHHIELIDENTALVTAQSKVSGSFKGKPIPEEIFVTQIWVKREGTWLQLLYQETDISADAS